jgi:hypothetical protein
MHISFKIIKYFISLYAARNVSDNIVSIIRSFLLLHMQSLVPVWCGCFKQPTTTPEPETACAAIRSS